MGHRDTWFCFNISFADPLGVILALASTLLWALYWLLNARDPRPPLVGQWQNFSVGLPVLTLLLLLGPGFQWHGWPAFGAGVYVGLFEMGVAFVLWQMAVQKVSRTAKSLQPDFSFTPCLTTAAFFSSGGAYIAFNTDWFGADFVWLRDSAGSETY